MAKRRAPADPQATVALLTTSHASPGPRPAEALSWHPAIRRSRCLAHVRRARDDPDNAG
jgi:hypothetical protein